MDRVGLHEAIIVATFLGLGRKLGTLGDIGVGKGSTHRVTRLVIAYRLEQSPPHDLKRLFGGDWLPKCLDSTKSLFEVTAGLRTPRWLPASTSDSGSDAKTIALGTSFTASVSACTNDRLLS